MSHDPASIVNGFGAGVDFAFPSCPDCPGIELELHQLDRRDPDRVVGLCPGCGAAVPVGRRRGAWRVDAPVSPPA